MLFLCGVAVKIYNVVRLGFFVRAQPTFRFGGNWHVPIYSARKTLVHLGKKILFTDIDRKKIQLKRDGRILEYRDIEERNLYCRKKMAFEIRK